MDNAKKIEENNRIGMARDLFKKIRDIKGTVHVRMGKIKDRNCKDLQKQKILRRGGKNTQTILKRSNDLENHDGVDTNLKQDILECEVKWALRSITTNKVMEFQLNYFIS